MRARLHRYLQRDELCLPLTRRLGIFVKQPDTTSAIVNELARLGSVRPGVSAEAVYEGLPGRWLTRAPGECEPVVATLQPQDFMKVWRAMDEGHRWLLGAGWAVEETRPQARHLLDLSQPERATRSPRDVPWRAQLSALWIDVHDTDLLQLGRSVDDLGRWAEASGVRLQRLPLYVCQEEVDPAIHRLLETRFDRVLYGYSERRFLGRRS